MSKYWQIEQTQPNDPVMISFSEYNRQGDIPTGRTFTFTKHDNILTVTEFPDNYEAFIRQMQGNEFFPIDVNNQADVERYKNSIGYLFRDHNLNDKNIERIMREFYFGVRNPNGRQWFRSKNDNLFDKAIVNFFADPDNFNINNNVNASPIIRGGKHKKSRKLRRK